MVRGASGKGIWKRGQIYFLQDLPVLIDAPLGADQLMTYAGGLTVAYQWDVANNLERLTWPDNFVVDYAWDANNRVTQALDGARVLADVSYDSLSRRQTVAYGNSTTVNHTWSNRGDLSAHDHSFIGASVDYDFTYNGVGQMLTKTLSNPAYGWVAPTTGTDTYLVNGLNQYTSIDGAAPMYDGNGNLTTDHQGRGFSYDAENVLRSASGLTGGTATYRYHADGSRRQKSHNGTTSHFYYMGGLGYLDEEDTAFAADQEIAEYSGAGVLQKRFVRLPGSIDEAFLMIDVSGGAPIETWAHMDRLGSVIATTDSTGVTNGTYRYSPYGKPGSEGASGFPFRFTGQRLDAETGLYYYKARYYDPETRRFLQTDPIGYDDNMNLYAYVGNDPVNGIDPTGKCTGTRLKASGMCPGGLKGAHLMSLLATGEGGQTDASTNSTASEGTNSQTEDAATSWGVSAELIQMIKASPGPMNSDLYSLGVEPSPGAEISVENGFRIALLGRTPGGSNLQSINEYADIALAAVALQVGGVATIGELGGAYLASESAALAAESIRQMRVNIVANKELLLIHAGRLQHSLTSGEGLGYALANSANTSPYPAWLLTRGAAAAGPPTITLIVD